MSSTRAWPLSHSWERAWSEEIIKRVTDIVDGKVELVDADDVHRELRDVLQ